MWEDDFIHKIARSRGIKKILKDWNKMKKKKKKIRKEIYLYNVKIDINQTKMLQDDRINSG